MTYRIGCLQEQVAGLLDQRGPMTCAQMVPLMVFNTDLDRIGAVVNATRSLCRRGFIRLDGKVPGKPDGGPRWVNVWARTDKPLPGPRTEPVETIEPEGRDEVPWPRRDYDAIVAQAVRSVPRSVFELGGRA